MYAADCCRLLTQLVRLQNTCGGIIMIVSNHAENNTVFFSWNCKQIIQLAMGSIKFKSLKNVSIL